MIPRDEEAFKKLCDQYPESNIPGMGLDGFLNFTKECIESKTLSSGGHWALSDYVFFHDGNRDYNRFLP